uniref:Uncharacterized protein n=1 Tax=Trichuris muris TaxID=70415 RepID=A0A5S6R3J4_TRIMR
MPYRQEEKGSKETSVDSTKRRLQWNPGAIDRPCVPCEASGNGDKLRWARELTRWRTEARAKRKIRLVSAVTEKHVQLCVMDGQPMGGSLIVPTVPLALGLRASMVREDQICFASPRLHSGFAHHRPSSKADGGWAVARLGLRSRIMTN